MDARILLPARSLVQYRVFRDTSIDCRDLEKSRFHIAWILRQMPLDTDTGCVCYKNQSIFPSLYVGFRIRVWN